MSAITSPVQSFSFRHRSWRPRRHESATSAPPPIESNWRPVTLRWPFLTFLFLSILGLLGFLEYSVRVLPLAEDRSRVPDDNGVNLANTVTTVRQPSYPAPKSTTTVSVATPAAAAATVTVAATPTPMPSVVQPARKRAAAPQPLRTPAPRWPPPYVRAKARAKARAEYGNVVEVKDKRGKSPVARKPRSPRAKNGRRAPADNEEVAPWLLKNGTVLNSTAPKDYLDYPDYIPDPSNYVQAPGVVIGARPPSDYAQPDVIPVRYYTWGYNEETWVQMGEGPDARVGTCTFPIPDGPENAPLCICWAMFTWDVDDPVHGCPYLELGSQIVYPDGECRERMRIEMANAAQQVNACMSAHEAGVVETMVIGPASGAVRPTPTAAPAVALPGITTILKITGVESSKIGLDESGRVLTTYTRDVTLMVPAAAVWKTATVVTLYDSNDPTRPTATITQLPSGVIMGSVVTTVVLTNERGVPTATVVSTLPARTTLLTLRDPANGQPTATVIGYAAYPDIPYAGTGGADGKSFEAVRMPGRRDVFLGSFMPVLLATLLALPVRMLDAQLRLMQPFRALTPLGAGKTKRSRSNSEIGGPAAATLCFPTASLPSRKESFAWHVLRRGDPLPLLSLLLAGCAIALVAVSPSAVGLKLHGSCQRTKFNGCFMVLAVFAKYVRVAQALLVAMAVMVFIIGVVVLGTWRTGLREDPWSLMGAGRLLGGRVGEPSAETRDASGRREVSVAALMREIGQDDQGRARKRIRRVEMVDALEGWQFVLDDGRSGSGRPYGLRAVRDVQPIAGGFDSVDRITSRLTTTSSSRPKTKPPKKRSRRWFTLDQALQTLFLVFLVGLLIIIIYYNTTYSDTPFEVFMDSQEFGVRFLFTLFGVIVSLFWDYYFSRKYHIPYHGHHPFPGGDCSRPRVHTSFITPR